MTGAAGAAAAVGAGAAGAGAAAAVGAGGAWWRRARGRDGNWPLAPRLGAHHGAPPTDNLLKRLLGLIGLSVGGLVTLVGAVATVMAIGAYITDTKHEVPFVVVPGALLPLLLGHALMYGGAKIRAKRAA